MTGLGIGIAGATAMYNQATQDRRENRSYENQKRLMGIQYQNQQGLNQQGADLSYQQWLKTNYPAQVEQMKKAGLNVGLMYGGAGGAGGTTQTSGGGSASGGNAPQPQQLDIADIMQTSLLKAQKENIEADTENKKSQTGRTDVGTESDSIDLKIKQALKEWEETAQGEEVKVRTA